MRNKKKHYGVENLSVVFTFVADQPSTPLLVAAHSLSLRAVKLRNYI